MNLNTLDNMVRLAIIDHVTHELFVEDVTMTEIEQVGGEQEYIDQNYTFEGEYSWDFIAEATYYSETDKTGRNIMFDVD